MSNLPPLPGHPEPHTYCWTSEEIAAIKKYGQQCHDAALDEAAEHMRQWDFEGLAVEIEGLKK